MKNVCYLHHNGFLIFEQRLLGFKKFNFPFYQNMIKFAVHLIIHIISRVQMKSWAE
jgi:hypothetical protein